MRQPNDALAELVRAAQGWLQGWPALSKAPVARDGHVDVADEPELATDIIAIVDGEKEFEALCGQVEVVELEPLKILSMNDWISQKITYPLQVNDHEVAPRVPEGEV